MMILDDINGRVKLFTVLEPTLESIASREQVERKLLRNVVWDLKEKLIYTFSQPDGNWHNLAPG